MYIIYSHTMDNVHDCFIYNQLLLSIHIWFIIALLSHAQQVNFSMNVSTFATYHFCWFFFFLMLEKNLPFICRVIPGTAKSTSKDNVGSMTIITSGSFSHRHLPFKSQLTSEWSLDFKGLLERFTDFSSKSQFTNFSRAFDIFEKVNFFSL